MNNITFKTLSPQELDKHRGTCPLEVWRLSRVVDQVQELIGPLFIYKIWSDVNEWDRILISRLKDDNSMDNNSIITAISLTVQEWSDNILYTRDGDTYLSLTKV